MKIVTLGAGAGTRLANLNNISSNRNLEYPKIIFPVMDKLMYQWSLLSYHHWITLGEIKKKDLVFVLQDKHNKDFFISEKICQYFGDDVSFAFVNNLTKGPAETAAAALNLIQSDEDLIINDCDHYFSSLTFLNLINALRLQTQEKDFLLLPSTKVSSDIPTWSYVRTESVDNNNFSRVLEIKEKDPYLAGIGAPGVIGAYYFSNRRLFERLFESAFKNTSGEYFISKMFECALSEGIPIYTCDASFGFPLGTPDDIDRFAREIGNGFLKYQGKSLFFDIDGILIEHDEGYHSKNQTYDYTKPLIDTNTSLLKYHFGIGDTIVLTTTRPSVERVSLEAYLSKNAIPYHHLIMGLNPGIRVLINDRKRSEFSVDTAIAVSVGRNKSMENFSNYLSLGDKILQNLTSGSGAETFRLESRYGKTFIRKAVLNEGKNERAIEILQLQGLWYKNVGKILPDAVPGVMSFYQSDGLCLLDMEDLGDLPTLSQLVLWNNLTSQEISLVVEDLLDKLGSLYSYSSTSIIPDPIYSRNLLHGVVHDKAIPAITSLFRLDDFNRWKFQESESLIMNGSKVRNPLHVLKQILDSPMLFSKFQKGFSGKLKCLIHGDLTLENILVTRDLKVRFIDPLGSFMDPLVDNSRKDLLQRTTPMFDLVKLLQSTDAGYEIWNRAQGVANLSHNGQINWRDDFLPATIGFKTDILEFYSSLEITVDEDILNFLLSLQLFRLIPYKMRIAPDKALFCLAAGSAFLQRSME